ncbi:uncharacterized protein [Panulirus ornatus]|uniref:uncharacterized protein isoform X2 n=1 Tax=Panulirus ornatus TaxID=150431 RepID=UPI003A835BF6
MMETEVTFHTAPGSFVPSPTLWLTSSPMVPYAATSTPRSSSAEGNARGGDLWSQILPVFRGKSLKKTAASFATSTSSDSAGQQQQEQQQEAALGGKKKGRIHSKKSIKVNLVGGKRYLWCACGYSKNQPFCDGTHLWSRFRLKIKQHPVLFKAPKDMQASLCLCKQTNKPPYCDGTHRRKDIQEAVIDELP